MTRHVWYVHGANSTPRSFAWLRDQFATPHAVTDITYQTSRPLNEALDWLKGEAAKAQAPFSIIAHSIGGVLAIGLANAFPDRVEKVVTLASPFLGCKAATMLRWLAPCSLFDDIHPYSPFITEQRLRPTSVPTLSIVTTAGGTPVLGEPNDGVVTVASQRGLRGPTYRNLAVNHFEVLLDSEAATLTRDFIFGAPT